MCREDEAGGVFRVASLDYLRRAPCSSRRRARGRVEEMMLVYSVLEAGSSARCLSLLWCILAGFDVACCAPRLQRFVSRFGSEP